MLNEIIDPRSFVEGYNFKNKDKRNCTVLALSASANISYPEADDHATLSGRKRNKGFRSYILIDEWNKKHQKQFTKCEIESLTLNKFVKCFPEGRYYLRKKGHAFAVVNGVVIDTGKRFAKKTKILDAWAFNGSQTFPKIISKKQKRLNKF